MLRNILIVFIALSLTACASRSRVKRFETDLNEIKTEVRTIRVLTDDMKDQISTMSHSMIKMNDDVKNQASEIQLQREHQEKLKGMVDDLKIAVSDLETGPLSAKKEELAEIKDAADAAFEGPRDFVVKTEKDGNVTKVYTEEVPKDDGLTGSEFLITNRPVQDTDSGFGYAVKDGVILWQQPNKKSDIMEILVSWQQLSLLEKVKKGGTTWWKVRTNDYVGYVNSRFIIVSE